MGMSARAAAWVEPLERRTFFSHAAAPTVPAGSVDTTLGFLGAAADWAPLVQDDGRILTPAYDDRPIFLGVRRHNPDGTEDATLIGGVVAAPAEAAALSPGGRVVLAGTVAEGETTTLVVTRLNPDGTPDATFGESGTVRRTYRRPDLFEWQYASLQNPFPTPLDVAVDADGSVLVAQARAVPAPQQSPEPGHSYGGPAPLELVLYRFDAAGAPDDAFGDGGTVVVRPDAANSPWPTELLVQRDGRVVVTATATADPGDDDPVKVLRLNRDGSLDATFGGGDGIADTGLVGVADAAFQGDAGKLVLIQTTTTDRGGIVLRRLDADGSVDPAFGEGGITSLDFRPGGRHRGCAMDVAPDGRIVVAGVKYYGLAVYVLRQGRSHAAVQFMGVFRLTPDGQRDPTFGATGPGVTVRNVGQTFEDWPKPTRVTVQPDGKPLVSWKESVTRYTWEPEPAAVLRRGRRIIVYGSAGSDTVSITQGDYGSVEVVVNGVRRVFDAGRVRVVWPGHGVLNNPRLPVSGTIDELVPAKKRLVLLADG